MGGEKDQNLINEKLDALNARMSEIEAKIDKILDASNNMNRHINFVETFFRPFLRLRSN